MKILPQRENDLIIFHVRKFEDHNDCYRYSAAIKLFQIGINFLNHG